MFTKIYLFHETAFVCQVWVTEVPEVTEYGKQLIFLPPFSCQLTLKTIPNIAMRLQPWVQ